MLIFLLVYVFIFCNLMDLIFNPPVSSLILFCHCLLQFILIYLLNIVISQNSMRNLFIGFYWATMFDRTFIWLIKSIFLGNQGRLFKFMHYSYWKFFILFWTFCSSWPILVRSIKCWCQFKWIIWLIFEILFIKWRTNSSMIINFLSLCYKWAFAWNIWCFWKCFTFFLFQKLKELS